MSIFSVYSPTSERCTSQHTVDIDSSDKVLSSSVSRQTRCGLPNTPWLLQAKPGQRIRLTLTDFSWQNSSTVTTRCVQRYGYILDTETDDVINICGGTERQKELYTSEGHSLQIVFDDNALLTHKFLVTFAGEYSYLLSTLILKRHISTVVPSHGIT